MFSHSPFYVYSVAYEKLNLTGTDKLYITHSEWSSSDAFSASVGAGAPSKARHGAGAGFRRLPFNFCAASLQPFQNPVCTADGTIFDAVVIAAWLQKRKTNPVNGKPLDAKDLIKLNFAWNADAPAAGDDEKGDLIDPVSYKAFTDNTHIVAIRHGSYANVFSWDTVEGMNIRAKMWKDLVDDEQFTRADIITLQDPKHTIGRDLSQFKHLKDGDGALSTPGQVKEQEDGNVNVDALGRIGNKVLRAKEAVERSRKQRKTGGDVNRSSGVSARPPLSKPSATEATTSTIQERKQAYNAATYTTGRAAASLTSTGLTPETSNERAILTDEEYMLRPRRVKHKGYARIETNLGDINVELQTEYAPRAVWNFVRLAQKGYYKGVEFHRNIADFMIQGGDPTGTGKGGTSIWGKNFKDEIDGPLTHDSRGVISMANKGKNTNSSQFFITYRAAHHLDRKHTVFGRVVLGANDGPPSGDVLRKMEEAPTDSSKRPVKKIFIKDVVVYVDPFDEFMREKGERERAEAIKAKRKAEGDDEDERMTWTGRTIRSSGTCLGGRGAGSSVGRYLNDTLREQQQQHSLGSSGAGDVDTWESQEPCKKKSKTAGGFVNFDAW